MEVFKNYFGGKGGEGVYQTIINHIPPHDILIIPFLGNCAITRNIKPCTLTICNDLDKEVITMWRSTISKNSDAARLASTKMDVAGRLNKNDVACRYLLIRKCALELLKNLPMDPLIKNVDRDRIAIYVDAPYPHFTRASRQRYRYELTNKQHY